MTVVVNRISIDSDVWAALSVIFKYLNLFNSFAACVVVWTQKRQVELMFETMEQLKSSDRLQRVASPYRRRAATFSDGDLNRFTDNLTPRHIITRTTP